MIIATAGHVDHGKTLLISSLTGVDTDRLPDEKKRGLTIDLGFAYLPVEDGPTIGFVDVPGHEKFIRNMLCGVAGIDAVLFIIAADDGPMPQTLEHLAILDLLGVGRGVVALTKIDRASPERVAEVEEEITDLLARGSLSGAPVFPVSAMTGVGMAALKDHLLAMARDWRPREAAGNFRLAVDRCFNVVGAGLVVTGTAFSGLARVGEKVRQSSGGERTSGERAARLRGIHAQNTASETGQAGQRCALNLAGSDISKDAIHRGDWVVTGNVPAPARKLDARLTVLDTEKRALTHWTPVHVHLAAAEATGRVAVLEGRDIAPGEAGLVQLVLDQPIGGLRGDGFIIRDQSAQRTIGGGRIIDVFPPARGRAKPERLAYLAAMETDGHGEALASLLDAAPNGLNLSRFSANRNLRDDEMAALTEAMEMTAIRTETGRLAFSAEHWAALRSKVLEALAVWHRRSPDRVGPTEDRLLTLAQVRLPREISVAVAAALAREGAVVKEGLAIRLPSHKAALAGPDAAMWKKVAPLLEDGNLRPPVVHELAGDTGIDPKRMESLLVRAGRHGLVIRVSKNRFYPPPALRRLGEIAEDVADMSEDGTITAKAFRDQSEIGRNLTIEVLEFFDRIKFTRRIGDAREILRPATEAFGGQAPSGAID